MTVGELCRSDVRTVPPDASVREAAHRMRRHGVDCLVVIDGDAPLEGIVTDWDLVIRALAAELDTVATPVRDVMTRGPAAVEGGVSVEQALHVMADLRVRRLVVLGSHGELRGVLAYEDLLSFLMVEREAPGPAVGRRVPA